MGIFKKKQHENPTEHDFSSLDAAVSELNKQTDALLGAHDSKQTEKSKPVLPKKNSMPQHMKGKSFDIIHDPNRRTHLKSTLKSAAPKAENVIKESEETPLLPDHATISYNEVETAPTATDPQPTVVNEESDTNEAPNEVNLAPAAIIQHHEGNLSVYGSGPMGESGPEAKSETKPTALNVKRKLELDPTQDTLEEDTSNEIASTDQPDTDESKTSKKNVELDLEETPPVEVEISSEGKVSGAKKPEETEPAKEAKFTEIVNKEKDSDPDKFQLGKDDDTAYNSGELFANNLVKESAPKGYEADESKEAPAVFDTTEYHPELHDWSKLESGGGLKWFVLLLLLVVVAAGAWFVLTGQQLPF